MGNVRSLASFYFLPENEWSKILLERSVYRQQNKITHDSINACASLRIALNLKCLLSLVKLLWHLELQKTSKIYKIRHNNHERKKSYFFFF